MPHGHAVSRSPGAPSSSGRLPPQDDGVAILLRSSHWQAKAKQLPLLLGDPGHAPLATELAAAATKAAVAAENAAEAERKKAAAAAAARKQHEMMQLDGGRASPIPQVGHGELFRS